MTFRAFSIGFSAALLALACGSNDDGGNGGGDEPEDVPTNNNPPINVPETDETCLDNALLDGCAPDGTGTPAVPAPGTGGPVEEDQLVIQERTAANILASNCGQCHGPALDQEDAEAGMNYINDFKLLAQNGKIEPLNSAASKIIIRMTDGSMPPPTSGRARVSQADINTVAAYIDNELAWPGVNPAAFCTGQVFSYDDLYIAVADDLADLDEDDALTTRYISLTNRYASGVCADSLDRDRQALFKMVNALSTEPTVVAPRPVDRDQLIYAIDLEDYGWEQPVDVVDVNGNIVSFLDKWEAIVANNPYAVPFLGDDADNAVEDSGTTVPVMLLDSMLDVATIGNLYYALIGVDVTQTIDDFVLNVLDVDVAQNLIDEDQVRAGTTKSRISRQDRVLQRDELGVRQGVLWQSFDFLDEGNNDSIFEDPFGFAEGGTEAIFTLNNNMLGFIIADENNLIVEDSDILFDTSQGNFRAITSISCSNCHQTGFIPVVDEVRQIAGDNALTSGLNRDEVEQLEAIYLPPGEFAEVIENDSNDFYRAALNRLDLPINGADPVFTVFTRFDQDVSLVTAAGDLGLTERQLELNLRLLQPEVNVLGSTTIDRDDFTQFYVNSLCELTEIQENAPDPVVCDAALAVIEADDLL